jgi:hypothetical protein
MTHAINGTRHSRLVGVPCADAGGRRRVVQVSPQRLTGRIALIIPPGESAVFSPHEARTLAQQLVILAAALDELHQGIGPGGVGGRTS